METCNLCKQPIKATDKAVFREDFHHLECWESFFTLLQKEIKSLKTVKIDGKKK